MPQPHQSSAATTTAAAVISPNQIRADIERYARLHSWYRHLSPQGEYFYIIFREGQQPRNDLDPQVQDSDHVHCWLIPKSIYESQPSTFDLPPVCQDHPVIFTRDLGNGPTSRQQINAAIATGITLADQLRILDPAIILEPVTNESPNPLGY
jgi:hypothetical protein